MLSPAFNARTGWYVYTSVCDLVPPKIYELALLCLAIVWLYPYIPGLTGWLWDNHRHNKTMGIFHGYVWQGQSTYMPMVTIQLNIQLIVFHPKHHYKVINLSIFINWINGYFLYWICLTQYNHIFADFFIQKSMNSSDNLKLYLHSNETQQFIREKQQGLQAVSFADWGGDISPIICGLVILGIHTSEGMPLTAAGPCMLRR